MLRRLCALLLMLACALAPALPTHAVATKSAEDCCCGAKCACDTNRDCAPAPTTPVRATEVVTTAVEQRLVAAKPATRVAFTFRFSHCEKVSARSACPESASRLASAAGVALYEAHCSRLI